MQKKYFNFQPKGMNTNMSPKFQSNEYATYMNNIRITKDNNGILSLQFERGNKRLNLDIKGCVIGTCVLNKYLVLFTQETNTHRRPNGEIVIIKTDHIYRLEIINEDLNIVEIFTGNLNFDTEYPLETLGVYENENIQKVYFIDGKNQARVINILEDYNLKYQDTLSEYKKTAFDFIAELQLNEEVYIHKIIGTGEFPQGTIQYVFSYYDKHGRQSNLFAQSDLQYLAYDKGVSPEEKVNCSFNISIYNVDKQFDYIRVYSIIRTSQDTTPIIKRVIDLPISNINKNETSLTKVSTLNTYSNLDDFGKTMKPSIPEGEADISFIDNGSIGDIIDPTELLYLGGNTICPNTFEQKDGTLFMGNYTINNNDISKETAINIRNLLGSNLKFKYKATSISYKGKNDYYNYEGQLSKSDVAGFKYMEWYGVAIQFQNRNGRFSSPIYLGSTRNYFPPSIIDYNFSEIIGVNRGELNLDIDIAKLVEIIDTNIWVKARLLIVNPTNNLKTVLCQGIISSTVFNYRDRYNNTPFTMSSWRMTSLGKHLKALYGNSISWGEIQNIEFSKSPIIGGSTHTQIYIKCIMQLGHYRTIVVFENNIVLYDRSTSTIIKAKENLKNWNSSININEIPDDSWENSATIHQEIEINGVDTIVNDFGECFAYDESLVTFNSPDIENQYNNINKNTKLRIIGILKSKPLFSNYLIQGNDLNDPSKGNVPTKNIKDFTSDLLWRDMDSSWDNLGNYDANKDWLFATYLWHRETSYSDNGIEKKNSNENSRKVWSKPVKKIISNTRECATSYLRDSLSYIDNIEEINKFNYYELPIDDIKVITTNSDDIYKLNSNMGDSYIETLSYTSDVNKLFPSNNEYPIYGRQYYAYNEDFISDYITYDTIIVDGKAVTSKDPIRIKYKETPHAIISFGSKNNSTIKLPRMSIKHKSEIDRVGEDAVVRKLFWNTENNSYTKDFIWTKYINEYANYMNPTNIETNYFFYNANPSINDYYYLADLCVQDPDTSPYESSNGNESIISQYSFIPAGEAIKLTGETVSLRGNHGDTYYQRWDCLKTFPYSTDDKNQYIDITSFFVESRINLDGRYDKQRGLKYNLGVLNTNFNLINKSYTQRNNFFNYRQIEDEGVINFPNQITISKTKVLGEDVDSWTNVTLASVFDLDGDKGKLNAIRKINNDLYCFQDNGISRLLYNSRVQINTSDGVPIEIANSAKLQDKQYLSDSIGCQNKWAIKSTSQGIYFIDTYNSELYKINDKGITPISQNKFKNYFTQLSSNIWSPSLWNYENSSNFIDSIKLEYDSTTYDLYIVSRDTALAYNELLGEFTSFYDYGSTLYWVNLNDKSLQINKDDIYEAYKGNYGIIYNKYSFADIEFIVNSEFDLDKIFETVELTTSDIAKINNWKSDYYPFDTLEVSNEYQRGKNEASSINVKKKFRTWRWQIPRNSKKNEDGIITNRDRIRNMWAKIRLSKKYNSPLSIYDINVAYYS